MATRKEPWPTLSLNPVLGFLDTRSRPADLPIGYLRWVQCISTAAEGKRCRRDGWTKAFGDLDFDDDGVLWTLPNPDKTESERTGHHYLNPDWHHRGGDREPVNFMFESTDLDGKRRLFAGTQKKLSLLDEAGGKYIDLLTDKGAVGSYWMAAELNNFVLFTNDVDNIRYYDISNPVTSLETSTIPDLVNTEKITKAKVIVSFMGFIILMNLVKEGQECPTTVQWCDFGLPLSWIVGTQDSLNPNQGKSVAGFQDLTYGDEILAAKELLGSLYIFTRRAIWKMYFDPTSTNAFGFQRVYSEPENQQGCIAYPRTLVSTGSNLYYMGRDAIYHYNPYIAAPQRPDQDTTDWLHRATGVIFRKSDTKMSGELCEPPTMAYKPLTKELWISWPTLKNDINTMTLVAQTEYKLADIVDAGFSCYCNYRRTQTATALCNEVQSFLGASTADYCLKDIGTGVFYREYVTLDGVVTADVQEVDANYVQLGYDSILRGLIPTGLYDREKIVRSVLVDHDTTEQDVPCVVKLRIGNNFNSVDANDLDDVCAPQWREFDAKPLACPDGATISELKAKNQKPSNAMQWAVYEQNRFLFFQLRITDPKDTDEVPVPAIGGDTCLTRIDFSCFEMPLPA